MYVLLRKGTLSASEHVVRYQIVQLTAFLSSIIIIFVLTRKKSI
jgi:hypothetical protein